MKIKSVVIDGMHNVSHKEYTFNDLNYITGHNGSGKSTILQSIQLALLGYIPGYKKTNSAIFEHSNGPAMSVSVVFDNNTSIRRTYVKTKSTVTSTIVTDPEDLDITSMISSVELPIFNFSEFINLSANAQKDWLIRYLPNTTSKINWHKIISDLLIKHPTATIPITYLDEFGADLDNIIRANTYVKGGLSVEKTQLERDSHTVQSLIYYDDIDANQSKSELIVERTHIMHKLLEQTKFKSKLDVYNNISNKITEITADLEKLSTDYSEAPQQLEDIDVKLAGYQDKRYQLYETQAALRATLASISNILKSNGACPYINEQCNKLKTIFDEYTKINSDTQIRLDEVTNEITQIDKYEVPNLLAQKSKYNNIISEYTKLHNELTSLTTQLANIKLDEIDIDVDYQTILDDINDKIAKLEANEHYDRLVNQFTKSKFEHESNIELLKELVKITGTNGIQSELADGPFTEFTHKLDTYITKLFNSNTHPKFLISGGANSFSFGLIDECNNYRPFNVLSSGEKCLFTIAMMMSIIEDSSINCIMIDDMLDHLDQHNLQLLFDAITKINTIQFIFAGVPDCTNNNITKIEVK